MEKQELKDTAFLARIDILEEEQEKYLKDLNFMMEYIEILQKPDVRSLAPTTHVTALRNVWRDDIVVQSSDELLSDLLKEAPEIEGRFFKIKKVINAQQ
ncbi:MAG: Asp-tRNA(Asn)/Glu-tRNA(Gln) amidotransferase subunit GatC [Elusimicrobiota bacterium]|jgi:aspartyl-tRNA(Asn)/glutamyl-tRNA(Gln) amidotransferase subunit C|nr:Asp-tRNA(Asn)/Glu-tRNA(Gln) amidotransferase subunit GatC [Elusimicrobiota bacterium]